MADQVTVRITTAVTDAGDFDVYEIGGNDVQNTLATDVPLATLQGGQTYAIASDTWQIKLHSKSEYGGCTAGSHTDVSHNFSQVVMYNADVASLLEVIVDYGGTNLVLPVMPDSTQPVTAHLPSTLEGTSVKFSIRSTAPIGSSWRVHLLAENGITEYTNDLNRPSGASPSNPQSILPLSTYTPILVDPSGMPKYTITIWVSDL